MTPPDHLLAGISIGAVYTSFCGLFSVRRISCIAVFILCGVFAVLPDVDSFRGVYSSTDIFIGHRGISHSIFFIVLISLIVVFLYAVMLFIKNFNEAGVESGIKRNFLLDLFFLLFFSGVSHLIMDLPQPPGVWKGIPLFFPLKNSDLFLRSGGWGMIGWYDYRITFILIVSTAAALILLSTACFLKSKMLIKKIIYISTILILFISTALIIVHINDSVFQGNKNWNESQRLYLEGFHPYVKSIITGGRTIILEFIN